MDGYLQVAGTVLMRLKALGLVDETKFMQDAEIAPGVKVPGTIKVWAQTMQELMPQATLTNWNEAITLLASEWGGYGYVTFTDLLKACKRVRNRRVNEFFHSNGEFLPDGLTAGEELLFRRELNNLVAGGEVEFPHHEAVRRLENSLGRQLPPPPPPETISESVRRALEWWRSTLGEVKD